MSLQSHFVPKTLDGDTRESGDEGLKEADLGSNPKDEKTNSEQSSKDVIQDEHQLLDAVKQEVEVPDSVRADWKTLEELAVGEACSPILKSVLVELLKVRDRVLLYKVKGSAYADRVYDKDGEMKGYEVAYHGQVSDLAKRIGNLVHELTHVSANESLDNDFLLYTNRQESDEKLGIERKFSKHGVDHALDGEGGIQNAKKDPTAENEVRAQLLTLFELKDSAGFTKEQVGELRERIIYGIQSPSIEYDTVLNQMAVWVHFWTAQDKNLDTESAFCVELEKQVATAQKRRLGDGTQATSEEKPSLAPLQAKTSEPVVEKVEQKDEKKRKKDCWLTSACTEARGLPDDCRELRTLRAFRDRWLRAQPGGPAQIAAYHATAPRLVAAIEASPHRRAILDDVFEEVSRCVALIEAGARPEALDRYARLVRRLEDHVGAAPG